LRWDSENGSNPDQAGPKDRAGTRITVREYLKTECVPFTHSFGNTVEIKLDPVALFFENPLDHSFVFQW
jgi:hypothetical protein